MFSEATAETAESVKSADWAKEQKEKKKTFKQIKQVARGKSLDKDSKKVCSTELELPNLKINFQHHKKRKDQTNVDMEDIELN